MLLLVALGGNAVGRPGEEGNIPQQFAATKAAMKPVADLLLAGHRIVITHGNGPQVGNVMRRIEIASPKVYPLPLDIIVADTEAGMGYMISQCLMNELASRGHPRVVTTIITTVRVDPSDPAFQNPTKPIGTFMSKEDADTRVKNDNWQVQEDAGRGYRRVVPSPLPIEIVELPLLKKLTDSGEIVVAAGGGGIPVMRDPTTGFYKGIEAVIDKDRTSAMLAAALNADVFFILTAVDQVQRDFNTPYAKALDKLTSSEAQALLTEGQFPPGSMAPKIEAAIDFLNQCPNPKAEVLITSCERSREALDGKTGTRITRD
jgi:carbamate kinase